MSSLFGLSKTRTFKPKRNIPEGTKQYQLKRYAEATLGSGNLRRAVILPDGEDLDEWLAVNTVDFFNHINMLYGTITEFCIPSQCPTMSAGARYEYHWQDSNSTEYRKPTKMSAPDYIDCLMTWTQAMLDNEAIFPSKIGKLAVSSSSSSIVRRTCLMRTAVCLLSLCRCTVPERLPSDDQVDPTTTFPRVCTHLQSPFRSDLRIEPGR